MRMITALSGAVLLIIAFCADIIGLSRGEGFPEGQILACTFGLFLILAAVSWKRFPALWRFMGRISLAAAVGLFSVVTLNSLIRAFVPPHLPETLIREGLIPAVHEPVVYTPHVMWTKPGSFPAAISEDSVWVYGESDTYLPGGLQAFADRRQPGYNSTQSLILLMLDLRSNPPPEEVFILAGAADVRAAMETGDPAWPAGSCAFMEATGSPASLSMNLSDIELTAAAARVQSVNRAILMALGSEYGFNAVFLWQAESSDAFPPPEEMFLLQIDSLLNTPGAGD